MTDQADQIIAALQKADVDPTLRLALNALGAVRRFFPSLIISDSLQALSFPYPAPMEASFFSFQSAIAYVESQEPIDANINVGITGNGAVVAGLPAGVVGGVYNAAKVSCSRGDNDPPSDWSIQLDGFFGDGEPYQLPPFQLQYANGSFTKGDVLVLVTRPTQAGPALCTARLRAVTYPNVDLQNGAPNMVAQNGLTLTVAGAPPNQRTTLQIGTKVTDINQVLLEIVTASALAGTRPNASVARQSDLAPPAMLSAMRRLR